MRLYLVRHGQSQFNAQRRHQVSTVGLSDLGLQQAALVSRRLVGMSIGTLLSSPYERAYQTAAAIGEATGLPVAVTPLLVEVRRPSIIQGRSYDDPEAAAVKEVILRYVAQTDWRHSDEETPAEAASRARACLTLWEELRRDGAECVAAVTHGRFLTTLVALMLYGDELHPRDILRLESFARMHNTGLTRCDLAADGRWTLLSWNDHAHLDALATPPIER